MFSPLEQFEIYNLSWIPNPFYFMSSFIGGVVGQGFFVVIFEYWKNLFLVSTCTTFFLFFFFILFI